MSQRCHSDTARMLTFAERVAHVVRNRRGDCYRGDMEPYTPFLGTRMAGDFKVPGYFLPMGLFRMGMGAGGPSNVPQHTLHHIEYDAFHRFL